MDWNDLRNQWQLRDPSNDGTRLARPHGAARRWSRVRARDVLETLVAALLVPFFAGTAFLMVRDGRWITAAFALFLVVLIVYVPWRLWRARRLIPKPDPNRPVREFLAAEQTALAAQARMLRSVAAWYYGPIALGVIGFYTSLHGASLSSLVYSIAVLAVCAFIEVGNRRAARNCFQPAIDELDEQIRQLEDENHD